MKTTFILGLIVNLVVGLLWAILGVLAIVNVYGASILWWMLGTWIVGCVLMYWPMIGELPGFSKQKTIFTGKE